MPKQRESIRFFILLLVFAFRCEAFHLESPVRALLTPLHRPHSLVRTHAPNVEHRRGKPSTKISQFLWTKRGLWISGMRRFRRRVLSAAVALLVVFSLHFGAFAATSGYRTGGSFKSSGSHSQSTSPPIQRTYSRPSSPAPLYSTQRPFIGITPAPWFSFSFGSHRYRHPSPGYFDPRTEAVARGFSAGDVVLLAGAGALIAYGFTKSRDRFRNGDDSDAGPLGPGATVASVTVCVNIPNIEDPMSILNQLRSISERCDTGRREGIQELIQESSLELLRNERIINSAFLDSKYYRDPEAALKDFNFRSVETRAKYDREVSRYGGVQRYPNPSNVQSSFSKASLGVITMNIAIDGDSTKLPSLRNRSDLLAALRRIASDAPVSDCLFGAEVVWQPAEPGEILTREELYYRYPNLITI